MVVKFGIAHTNSSQSAYHARSSGSISIGSEDDYDNGADPCKALAQEVNPGNNNVVQVAEYRGAYHGWDRLMIPITVPDIFADRGSYFTTGVVPMVEIKPDVEMALESRKRVVSFFRRHL